MCFSEVDMKTEFHLLDAVALTEDLPEENLLRGQVGTIVDFLAPDVYEVEFSDTEGHTYALTSIHAEQLMALHYSPAMPS